MPSTLGPGSRDPGQKNVRREAAVRPAEPLVHDKITLLLRV